jgi:hypothetical protein
MTSADISEALVLANIYAAINTGRSHIFQEKGALDPDTDAGDDSKARREKIRDVM